MSTVKKAVKRTVRKDVEKPVEVKPVESKQVNPCDKCKYKIESKMCISCIDNPKE